MRRYQRENEEALFKKASSKGKETTSLLTKTTPRMSSAAVKGRTTDRVASNLCLETEADILLIRTPSRLSLRRVRAVMGEFVGDILQRPPLRSSVQRSTRLRRIYYLADFEFKDRWVLFRVGCQAGTYIRKLVYDVGEVLGSGAHMQELRRTRAGAFHRGRHRIPVRPEGGL